MQFMNEQCYLDKSVSSVLAQIPQGVFKDPYIFEFLDLPDVHSEKDFASVDRTAY